MKTIFSGKSYTTPSDTKRDCMDRVFLNSRWWFYFKLVRIIMKNRKKAQVGMYGYNEWIESSFETMKEIEKCGGRFVLSGFDNLKKSSEPVVIISNHMSTLETMIFPCILSLHGESTFVVKKSLTTNRFFGHIMRSRNPIALERKNPREDLVKVMTDGVERLKNGISVVIFPQSTRTEQFDESEFNSLGIKLAKKAGVKVIPVAIKTDFWGNSKIFKTFGKLDRSKTIYMEFGEPLEIEGNGSNEHQTCINFIKTKLNFWKS